MAPTRTHRRSVVLLLFATLAPALAVGSGAVPGRPEAPPQAPPGAIAFVDVAVLPMDRDRALEHQTVLVRDGRIAAVGPAGEVAVPAGALRVDGRGRWLLPGFTDAHVHLVSPIELPLYLANGVTTVINLHGDPAYLEWRARVASGELLGPAIFTTGPTLFRTLDPETAVAAVEAQQAAGYDGIKIYNQVGAEEYPAIVAAARRLGMLLTGHVARRPGFEATMRAGQSIAHAEEFLYTWFNPQGDDDSAHIDYDPARIPGAVELAVQGGVTVTPTISTYRDIVRQATALDEYLRNPELRYLSPAVRAGLEPGVNRYDGRYPPEEIERMKLSLGIQRRLVRALASAGVPILAGTDATAIGPVAGFALHEELAELVEAGLSPYEALVAATAAPARWLGGRSEAGTIAAGRRADLVLLAADPRADIRATRRIEGVVAAGRWLDRAALDAEIEAIPAAYERELEEQTARLAIEPDGVERYLAAHDPQGFLTGVLLERAATGAGGVPALVATLGGLRARSAESRLAGENAINALGYRLLALGRTAEAIAVFESNVAAYPASANALDSLAEAWAKSGDEAKAVELYRRALEVEPEYPNAPFAREFLRTHAREPG